MLNFCGIVTAILKMATSRNFSMSGHHYLPTQGSTLTVARLPGASEMRLRASENGTQLARSGK